MKAPSDKYRLSYFNNLKAFFDLVYNGKHNLKSQHISLYMWLLHQANRKGFPEWIEIEYDIAVQGSGIGHSLTYRKVLDELEKAGVILYTKGKNRIVPCKVNIVQLFKNEQLLLPLVDDVVVSLVDLLPASLVDAQVASLMSTLLNKLITNNIITLNVEVVTKNPAATVNILKEFFLTDAERKEKEKSSAKKEKAPHAPDFDPAPNLQHAEQLFRDHAQLENIERQTKEKITQPIIDHFLDFLYTEHKAHPDYVEFIRHLRTWMPKRPKIENGVALEGFPNAYDPKFEKNLDAKQMQLYWAHLRKNGWQLVDGNGKSRNWVKVEK